MRCQALADLSCQKATDQVEGREENDQRRKQCDKYLNNGIGHLWRRVLL